MPSDDVTQQRRIVFFLGAGASLGAGAVAYVQGHGIVSIPTQESFWQKFLRFCKSKENARKIEAFLFRYFLGYRRVPARLRRDARRALLQPIDVEEVFTFLSERIIAPGLSPSTKVYMSGIWTALLEEIGGVFAKFPANTSTRRTYRRMLNNHIRSRDTVVSFNYDLVFETSLPASQPWHYGAITRRPHSLRILKPHGSINWEENEGIVLVRKGAVERPAMPIIVAPTHLKFISTNDADSKEPVPGSLNQSTMIQDVWAVMEREMREAKALVFIGYSFPPSDLYFSSILRSALTARDREPHIVVVNPDSMAIGQRLRTRFSVDREKIKAYSDLGTFNQVTRRQLLE